MRKHNTNQNTVSVFISFSKSVAPLNLLVHKLLIKGFACHANKLTVNLTLAVDAELARVRSAASNHSILGNYLALYLTMLFSASFRRR